MNFDAMFDRLMKHEGGYINHPNDPGGETNWGISKRSYPNVDIKNLTKQGAKDIYYRDFWTPLSAEALHPSVAWQLLDFAVNSGIGTAIRAYQRALGVADDGHFGPRSMAAAVSMSETDQVMRLLAERLEFMTRTSGWPHFGKGWARRIADNLRFASDDS